MAVEVLFSICPMFLTDPILYSTIPNQLLAIARNLTAERRVSMITVVSGLPRSGTSMMMRMLEAGGVTIVTDHVRKPDSDNPIGYYEYEKVKGMKGDVSWLDHCEGKAVKIVSQLLYFLPMDRSYRVIFMERKMEEILASQKVMLERLGMEGAGLSDEQMIEKFEEHLRKLSQWLLAQGSIEVLYVTYGEVIQEPHEQSARVNRFLGGSLDMEEMASAVEKSLYRQKG